MTSPGPYQDNVTALPSRPPRAVFITSDPLLAEHVRALDPRVQVSDMRRLPGSNPPLIPPTHGLLLLAGAADPRQAASTGLATISRTLYVATNLDDASIWSRSAGLHAHTVVFLPDDDYKLQAEINDQLGPAATATLTPGPGYRTAPAPGHPRAAATARPVEQRPERPESTHALSELTDADLHDPLTRWRHAAEAVDRRLPTDPHWPALEAQLERIHANGRDVPRLLKTVAWDHPLPEDNPGRALADRLTGAVPGTADVPIVVRAPGAPGYPSTERRDPPPGMDPPSPSLDRGR